jgi:holliday junction DNA helicase RuvA
MFAKLTGTIDTRYTNAVIIDVGGVGYLVTCSSRTLAALGPAGTPARLHIETQVREDAINLFGFADVTEQSWFRTLITVQGVGARVAMNILSVCSPHEVHMAIAAQDKTVLTQADGVGPKLAVRILTELKDKVPEFNVGQSRTPAPAIPKAGAQGPATADNDAVSALVNLGYNRAEAFTAVMRARTVLEQDNKKPDSVSDLIRLSLADLGQGG